MLFLLFQSAFANPEWCDGIDNDGDGAVDEGPHLVFADADGDQHGDAASFVVVPGDCTGTADPPPDDCDDQDGAIHPAAPERCNGLDDDCDGDVDSVFACSICATSELGDDRYLRCGLFERRTWAEARDFCTDNGYALAVPDDLAEHQFLQDQIAPTSRWIGLQDLDGDGGFETTDGLPAPYTAWATGMPQVGASACVAYTYTMGQPVEGMCDFDCDEPKGVLCETTCTLRAWYADDDGDGQGDEADQVLTCRAPAGFVGTPGDCDDTDPARHTTASETCNALDDDCDGTVDNGAASAWYADSDGDGFGDPVAPFGGPVVDCSSIPSGFVANPDDCDPLDPDVFPGAPEVCNGVDDDCDGDVDLADDDLVDGQPAYADADGDGFGDPAVAFLVCTVSTDQSVDDTDCDDGDTTVNPGAVEVCNGFDDDCDGDVDDDDGSLSGAPAFYLDQDGDGLGDPSLALYACVLPAGAVDAAGDCDDADPDVGVGSLFHVDADLDGYGGEATTVACGPAPGIVDDDSDCDDLEGMVNPGQAERCTGIDDDCDGLVDDADPDRIDPPSWYPDADQDGAYGGIPVATCEQPPDTAPVADDCDDGNAVIGPFAPEVCNGIDDDCDGLIDDADPDVCGDTVAFVDADADGYGDPTRPIQACGVSVGAVVHDTDCDDDDASIHPDAEEVVDDGIDQDCDGADAVWTYGNGCSTASPRRLGWIIGPRRRR